MTRKGGKLNFDKADTLISLAELELAINYWLRQEEADGMVLGPHARALADVYGAMIYEKKEVCRVEELNAMQSSVLLHALLDSPEQECLESTDNREGS